MPDPKNHQAFLNLCDMAIDTMYELEAIGELLEQKGLMPTCSVDGAKSSNVKEGPRPFEAPADVFDYIERFYNRRRRHSHTEGLPPGVYAEQI